jgi:hypothetical protein
LTRMLARRVRSDGGTFRAAGTMTPRRFPPPWTVIEHAESFWVQDVSGQTVGIFRLFWWRRLWEPPCFAIRTAAPAWTQSEAFRAAHHRAGENKHPQFEGFEVHQTVGMGEAQVA